MSLSAFDLGWVVAFLEGEGSFTCSQSAVDRSVTLKLSATQKQRWPLERLVTLCGGRIYVQGRLGMHGWHMHNKPAAALIHIMLPHLSPRRQAQATTAVERWERRPLLSSAARAAISRRNLVASRADVRQLGLA